MAAVVAPRQARSLLITFDAFDTLYSPRTRIALQYLRVAKKYDAHIEGEREMEITFRNGMVLLLPPIVLFCPFFSNKNVVKEHFTIVTCSHIFGYEYLRIRI